MTGDLKVFRLLSSIIISPTEKRIRRGIPPNLKKIPKKKNVEYLF